ncbi:MAG: hypothetical protein EU518_00095 [Promethearchaeota archaeon]|nr:MAG: hypothetical protein EU518_00095 [Candidatus Lokiarchaeota archaeon]
MKYGLVLILIIIGILTLLRLRGIYLKKKIYNTTEMKNQDFLNQIRLILGFSYIFLGIGILFNYLIYFMMWILDPLPDRVAFFLINKIVEIQNSLNLDFLTPDSLNLINLIFNFLSFLFFFELLLSVWYMLHSYKLINNPKVAFLGIISGLIGCILFGFTAFMPYFL